MRYRTIRFDSQGWWEQENDEGPIVTPVHERLFPHVQALEEDQIDQHLQNLMNARLYSNRDLMAFEWNDQIEANLRPLNCNLENVIQSICDTLRDQLLVEPVKPTVVTRGADFDVYLRGRQLERFLWGDFLQLGIYERLPRLVLDSLVYGTAFAKMDIDNGEVFFERVHPDEIVVDQRECVSQEVPFSMFQRKLVSRMWLLAVYKDNEEAKEAILECQTKEFVYTSFRTPYEDQIVLVEGWKRPSASGSGDGRHVLCSENFTFVDEAYKKEYFPIIDLRLAPPESGFYGRPLVTDLMDYQIRLNELNELIRLGQDLMCVPRLFIEEGSQVSVTQLDNRIAKAFRYRGTMPVALTWNAFHAEIYNERDRIKDSAYQFAGLDASRAQVTAPNPQTRFDSRPALREHKLTQDERNYSRLKAVEDFILAVATRDIELSAQVYKGKSGKKRTANHVTRSFVEQIDWSDVNMERDQYVLQIGASSVMNMTPAARRDTLEAWLAEGKISLEQYHGMSGQPDLERLSDNMQAAHDVTEFGIQKMLKGEAVIPTPMDCTPMSFAMVHDTYLRLTTLDTPIPVLTRFLNWLGFAKEILEPGSADTPPADPAAMATDPAMMPPAGVPNPNVNPVPLTAQPGIVPADLSAGLAGNVAAAGTAGPIAGASPY